MGAILTQEQFDREAGFRLSLSIMNRLMEENLLTPKEYRQIEGILGRKFSPVWAGLPDTIKDPRRRDDVGNLQRRVFFYGFRVEGGCGELVFSGFRVAPDCTGTDSGVQPFPVDLLHALNHFKQTRTSGNAVGFQ